MKKAVLVSLLLSIFFLLSCEKNDDVTPEFALDHPDQLGADEYQVYNIIMENLSPSQLIIVRQETSVYTPPKGNFELFFTLQKLANMDTILYSRYVEENLRSYLLDERIEVPAKETRLMSNKEYAYYFDREDSYKAWELFKNNYPDADGWCYAINKIGFNEERTQAIVGVESYWFMESPEGPTLKMGALHYLEKKNGVWTRVGTTTYPL